MLRMEERRVNHVSLGGLWFGLIAGPVAWAMQELVGYGLAARACAAHAQGLVPLAPGLGVGEVIVSGMALGLAGSGLATSTLFWRRASRQQPHGEEGIDAGDERNAFMALAGIIVGLFFLFGVFMNAAGYFLIPPCG